MPQRERIRFQTMDNEWSDWYDVDDNKIKSLLDYNPEIKAMHIESLMTREEFLKYLEGFKCQYS